MLSCLRLERKLQIKDESIALFALFVLFNGAVLDIVSV